MRPRMDSPIFVFSAGWRSGSTLVQRFITASRTAMIWGECAGAISHLSNAFNSYSRALGPDTQTFSDGLSGGNGTKQYENFINAGNDGVHEWIANINPPQTQIETAFKSLIKDTYADTASQLGYTRWGIKEVRCGRKEIDFLHRLFPKAQFVLIVRDPFYVLTSIKRRNLDEFPGSKFPMLEYAKHWARLAHDFRDTPYGHLIRYEDFVNEKKTRDELLNYLGLPQVENNFVETSKADWKPKNKKSINWLEKIITTREIKNEASHHGYHY